MGQTWAPLAGLLLVGLKLKERSGRFDRSGNTDDFYATSNIPTYANDLHKIEIKDKSLVIA